MLATRSQPRAPSIYVHKDVKWSSGILDELENEKKGLRCLMSKMLEKLAYLTKFCA